MKFTESDKICFLKLLIILVEISYSYCDTSYQAPKPPSYLKVLENTGNSAVITWKPPRDYSSFTLRMQSSNKLSKQWTESIPALPTSYRLHNLVPGETYFVKLSTVLHEKESVKSASLKFTTKPSTPGKFIVWFQNETALLTVWNPPKMGIFTHYKVSLEPQDAPQSVQYIKKGSEPLQSAQAAFTKLIPGRAYKVSVQTVSEGQVSKPRMSLHQTVPSRPSQIVFDNSSVTSTSFRVSWLPPKDKSEFDKYQITLSSPGHTGFVKLDRADECVWHFEDLEPGKTYRVSVQTIAGEVLSWPINKDITVRPLPVRDLRAKVDEETGKVMISWTPGEKSTQDTFKVQYQEIEPVSTYTTVVSTEDSNYALLTNATEVMLRGVVPGRNYSISVRAISNVVESSETVFSQVVKSCNSMSENVQPIDLISQHIAEER